MKVSKNTAIIISIVVIGLFVAALFPTTVEQQDSPIKPAQPISQPQTTSPDASDIASFGFMVVFVGLAGIAIMVLQVILR